MSHLRLLSFQYNISKLPLKPTRWLSSKDRQPSDLTPPYKPDREEMRKVFNMIAGGPGKISREDLQILLEQLGKADAACEARRMMQVADRNKDRFIDFDEFMEIHKKGVNIGEIKRAFFVFDRDGDGKISPEEVMEVLQRLGDNCSLEDCKRMVRKIDSTGDGFVDMDDFMAMMTRPRQRT